MFIHMKMNYLGTEAKDMISTSDFARRFNSQEPVEKKIETFSPHRGLNRLLKSVFTEVTLYAEDQMNHIKRLAEIGQALSAEKNIGKLLEKIVSEARSLSKADAGTLYILSNDKNCLCFEILQNDTLKTRMGGLTGKIISLPDVPVYKNGKPNHSNVSSYAALTGEQLNFPDVYEAEGFDFTGTKKYDVSTGYRSKSMLVIPMKNHENEIIGVLQLLNAKNPETGEVVAFSSEHEHLMASLASQAAVALTNTQLIRNLKELFYAFIQSIATAIDEKSPYTGGHIRRVVDLTMMIADRINQCVNGPFKNVCFSQDQMEELRLAAWMHDVGKITTPEYVVDKATRLQSIFDRLRLIETRFHLIAKSIENDFLQRKIERLKEEKNALNKFKCLDEEFADKIRTLQEEFQLIEACNDPCNRLSDDEINCIRLIGKKTYRLGDMNLPYLTDDEMKNLCIKEGTLTEKERKIVQNHVNVTLKILNELPFPRKLENVPEYAGGHHEKLDGSGYPKGLLEKELPLQSRIMAIADIFEALTARDRPYKKPMHLSEAIKIMNLMKDNHLIDQDVFDLFIQSHLFHDYAKKEMNPEQVDI
jgi:HD-GYP domain-containing protein (c-di-GMP phosphodiesterase class II)